MITLTSTNSAAIARQFTRLRTLAGSPAMGMVMTLVVVTEEKHLNQAREAARQASHEHPARVLLVTLGSGRGRGNLDAIVQVGNGWTGETAILQLSGELVKHPQSVVLPLLLPDSPVVVWWPNDHPDDPAQDPLGKLAQRRITDAAFVSRGKVKALHAQCEVYSVGNSDLAWTRITNWRALLAASLDQYPNKVNRATVTAEKISPSADLLRGWLSARLKVEVERAVSDGPGITQVTLATKDGDITISRKDGTVGVYSSPGQPDRPVALRRRSLPELLAEELRHLDEDDIYAEAARRVVWLAERTKQPARRSTASKKSAAKKTTAKKTASKKTANKKAASKKAANKKPAVKQTSASKSQESN